MRGHLLTRSGLDLVRAHRTSIAEVEEVALVELAFGRRGVAVQALDEQELLPVFELGRELRAPAELASEDVVEVAPVLGYPPVPTL